MAELRKHCMRTAGLGITGLNIILKHMLQESQYRPELSHTYAKYFLIALHFANLREELCLGKEHLWKGFLQNNNEKIISFSTIQRKCY